MSFLKKAVKFAGKAAKVYASYQTGGLSGLATSALSKAGKKAKMRAVAPMMASQLSSKFGGGISAIPASFVGGGGGMFAGSGATSKFQLPQISSGGGGGGGFAGPKPRLTKDGRVTMRRRHRINPGNVKALRRSIRRLKQAEKLFRTVLTVQGKPHAGIKPKSRKR